MDSAYIENRLPIRELTHLVRDLHTPRAGIFWTDLVICVVIAAAGLYLSMPFPWAILSGSPAAIGGFFVAVLALYRASYFNHELSHHGRRMPGFEIGWNVLIGIPLLIPSFLYSDHRNHHSDEAFGTYDDVEYFPPRLRGLRGAAALFVASFLLPLIYVARFSGLLVAAWVSPRIRRWVDTRASSLGILGLSRRTAPTATERRVWRIQEIACFFYLLVCGLGLLLGIAPVTSVLHIYAVIVCVLFLHGIRIMVGHRYESDGNARNRIDQVLDSFNFTRNRVVTSLLAPLGFDLHALHHLFPSIPYHNMARAHRRIAAALPADSLYHSVTSPSYFTEVARFLMRRPARDIQHLQRPGSDAISA
ncbi:MAG: fatty acid desaturase [Proteobacteria bacterium]|nr:fatty acid desaturase [Pseudomonadota bacterium]